MLKQVTPGNMVLRAYPLEKSGDEIDADRVGAFMPVGAKPFGIVPRGEAIFLTCFVPEAETPRVWHPMVIAVMDKPIMPPTIGRTYGEPICLFPMQGIPTALVPELPWPTSTLEAIATQGDA